MQRVELPRYPLLSLWTLVTQLVEILIAVEGTLVAIIITNTYLSNDGL